MNLFDLPYLPRPNLENELQIFLRAHLTPRANTTKAILLSGERGVGKRTLLQYCLDSTPELQRYAVYTLDFHALALHDLEERDQRLKEKSLDSVAAVVIESSPYLLKLLLGVLHIFTKDQILKTRPQGNFRTLSEIEEFLFLLIKQQPVLLVIENFERDNTEHVRSLAHLVNMSYKHAEAFVLVMVAHEASTTTAETLKNLQRFLRRDDHLRGLSIAPLTQQESIAQLTACGLSSAWAETLHRFSEGYLGLLNSMWRLKSILQSEGVYVIPDDPRNILSRDFVRARLRKLVQRHQDENILKFHEPLVDALLLAAAMGKTFLPQVVAEVVLPRERQYSADEVVAWEDLWYAVLEESREDTPALAMPVQEKGENKTMTGTQGRSFFVYRFCDPQWQSLLQNVAKQLCDPTRLDQPFYESLVHLEEWLQAHFQENWEQALPYRIAVNRTLWQNEAARSLAKLQRLQKLRLDLPQQINAEHKRVAQGATAEDLYELLRWYCEVLHESDKYPEALDAMCEAHALLQQKIQFTDLELAEHLNELGLCYYHCGEYTEAEPLYRRSLAIREEQLGAEHLHVASILSNLATLLKSQDKFSEAEPLYRRSLAIREEQLGPEHPHVAASLNDLAILMREQSKYDEAEPLYRRSHAIDEKQLGPEHPQVAVNLNNLAVLLGSQGKSSEAEPLYRRSLVIKEKHLGKNSITVATSLIGLAGLLESQGKYGEAEPLYRRSLAINEKQLGLEHPKTTKTLMSLAILLNSQGKSTEAELLLQHHLAICEQKLGPEHPSVATSSYHLAELLNHNGKSVEAEPLVRRSLEIRERQFGPDDPAVADSLDFLAYCRVMQKEFAEAVPLYRRSLAIREKQLGLDHPDVATHLKNLALLLKSQGEDSEAEPLFWRALEIREKSLGLDHPDTQTVQKNYAQLLEKMKASGS